MSFRRAPNPNRNHPLYCPYCAGEMLFPAVEDDFAWSCSECTRVFSVRYHGQNDPVHRPAPARSTSQAVQDSLAKHGHTAALPEERAQEVSEQLRQKKVNNR
ncbi:hypothetical protein [Corynebacterium alimapuense]|uniref:Uncharacterized protein n=1 Tax=Corynebacterium alimapuense TaxID=1576874 RepID=A0A3M8K9S0_9CORY|nr:hypothetical protein [Corynebacterium alimapuense]RNE49961.1 hypothetical protein C5L39_00870 [Corynebacterium alimapuense]